MAVAIYIHQMNNSYLIISLLFLLLPGDKYRQISNAAYQHCIQQMNLLERLMEEMADDDGINRNREPNIKCQNEKRF